MVLVYVRNVINGDNTMTTKENILLTIDDLCTDFLYYDRKEDESLPRGAIQKAVEDGEITVTEMAAEFERLLRNSLK